MVLSTMRLWSFGSIHAKRTCWASRPAQVSCVHFGLMPAKAECEARSNPERPEIRRSDVHVYHSNEGDNVEACFVFADRFSGARPWQPAHRPPAGQDAPSSRC